MLNYRLFLPCTVIFQIFTTLFTVEKINKSLKNHQSFAKKVLLLFKLKYNPLWNGCEVTVKNSIHKHAVAHCTMTKTANFAQKLFSLFCFTKVKGSFYSESAICFPILQISKKVFQIILTLKFEFVANHYWREI